MCFIMFSVLEIYSAQNKHQDPCLHRAHILEHGESFIEFWKYHPGMFLTYKVFSDVKLLVNKH